MNMEEINNYAIAKGCTGFGLSNNKRFLYCVIINGKRLSFGSPTCDYTSEKKFVRWKTKNMHNIINGLNINDKLYWEWTIWTKFFGWPFGYSPMMLGVLRNLGVVQNQN